MPRIEWHDRLESVKNDEQTTHVIATVKIGFDFYLFIDTDKKTIEKQVDAILKSLSKEKREAITTVYGEMSRVTNSMFLLRINPLSLFCSIITEIGATEDKSH